MQDPFINIISHFQRLESTAKITTYLPTNLYSGSEKGNSITTNNQTYTKCSCNAQSQAVLSLCPRSIIASLVHHSRSRPPLQRFAPLTPGDGDDALLLEPRRSAVVRRGSRERERRRLRQEMLSLVFETWIDTRGRRSSGASGQGEEGEVAGAGMVEGTRLWDGGIGWSIYTSAGKG